MTVVRQENGDRKAGAETVDDEGMVPLNRGGSLFCSRRGQTGGPASPRPPARLNDRGAKAALSLRLEPAFQVYTVSEVDSLRPPAGEHARHVGQQKAGDDGVAVRSGHRGERRGEQAQGPSEDVGEDDVVSERPRAASLF